LQIIFEVNPLWILWSVCWFVFSKIISAYRFNLLLSTENMQLESKQNLKLYWLGMYYNLLLPGGISGDGYKIKILMDAFQKPFKTVFTITLLDRLTGVIALIQLALLLLPFSQDFEMYWSICWIAIALCFLLCYFIYRWVDKQTVWLKASIQSIGVQATQLMATMGLIYTLGQSEYWVEYLELFLISSLATMVPITVGGAGARELVFLYGSQFMHADAEKAVAIGFLFYLISTAVSLTGIVFSFHKNVASNLNKQ
jgi:uncharacterized membrane protein YbhN (UPF0104 family)